MNAPAPAKRSAWLWIAVLSGGSCVFCTLGTVGLVALGALSADDAPTARSTGGAAPGPTGGGEWLPVGAVARGTGLSQPLVGGRWLSQSGSSLETITARFAESVLVETSAMGRLHELRFEDDGTYLWHWVAAGNFHQRTLSAADERGSWMLEGTSLTLTPTAQQARYANSAMPQPQDKEDADLSVRRYQVVDLTLETVPHTGAPMKRFPGVELKGPSGPWDLEHGGLTLNLQRL